MSYKGRFNPKNTKKYKGDHNNIIYRSLWEFKLMQYLDSHPHVLEWASEEFFVPYIHPVDKQLHRYFPDFWVKKKTDTGTDVLVIEVKPSIQTKAPVKGNKRQKTFINEAVTYAINEAKWKAAMELCKDHGWKFMLMTEKELGIKF
jgi:hypothetical protein